MPQENLADTADPCAQIFAWAMSSRPTLGDAKVEPVRSEAQKPSAADAVGGAASGTAGAAGGEKVRRGHAPDDLERWERIFARHVDPDYYLRPTPGPNSTLDASVDAILCTSHPIFGRTHSPRGAE